MEIVLLCFEREILRERRMGNVQKKKKKDLTLPLPSSYLSSVFEERGVGKGEFRKTTQRNINKPINRQQTRSYLLSKELIVFLKMFYLNLNISK